MHSECQINICWINGPFQAESMWKSLLTNILNFKIRVQWKVRSKMYLETRQSKVMRCPIGHLPKLITAPHLRKKSLMIEVNVFYVACSLWTVLGPNKALSALSMVTWEFWVINTFPQHLVLIPSLGKN